MVFYKIDDGKVTEETKTLTIQTEGYINKFQIRMQSPTTQEEIDRRDNTSSHIQITSDIMNMVSDIEDPTTKGTLVSASLRISKESIFTGLNNLATYPITRNKLSEYYGFTQNEVEEFALCMTSNQNNNIKND